MNCKKAKKSGILFWEQPEPEQKELQDHWQECPECRESFQTLANSIELYRQNLQSEEKLEDFSHYWHKLSKHLVKPTWPEMAGQKIKGALSLVSRSIWGPVPAYAVAAAVILIAVAVLPFSKGTRPGSFPTLENKYNLVIGQHELVSATARGGLTVYALAHNTTPR